MAEARLLRKKISNSERVNSLPIGAALLFTWMIPHLDREGRMSGNPKIVKRTVFPLQNFSLDTIDKWLDQMQELKDDVTGYGLVERYEVNGHQYLWMPGFDGEQGKARDPSATPSWKMRESPSDIPPPPDVPIQSPEPSTPAKKRAFEHTEEIVDPVFKEMIVTFEDNIGICTPILADRIKDIQDNYPEGWFSKAVQEAVTYGKRNLKYIERVLESWKQDGFDPFGTESRQKPTSNNQGTERVQEYHFD